MIIRRLLGTIDPEQLDRELRHQLPVQAAEEREDDMVEWEDDIVDNEQEVYDIQTEASGNRRVSGKRAKKLARRKRK